MRLEIFRGPEPGHVYIVSADVAEGLDSSGNPDQHSADVLDVSTLEQVAHLHGLCDTHTYGLMLVELATWYNTALLAPERNNDGKAVLNAIMHSTDYPWMEGDGDTGLYFHTEFDRLQRMESRKPGFPTNVGTRPLLLNTGKTLINGRACKINSPQTIKELYSFVQKPGRKAEAENGAKDDAVMSLLIALYLSQTLFFDFREMVTGGERPDFTVPVVAKAGKPMKPPIFGV
jgi:hypothetical protein